MFIVSFHGGFANQLFIYAFYLKLKECFPQIAVKADLSHYKNCKLHGGFKLDRFVKLDVFKKKIDGHFLHVDEKSLDFDNLDYTKDYYFDGYWQEKKYFPADMTLLQSIFSTENLKQKNKGYFEKIKATNSVSVHVRRGDYVNHFLHGGIANKCYLQNSIEYIKSNVDSPHFFVFSDDLEWAKNNLDFGHSAVDFIGGNSDDVEQDIILMSSCRHNIISNSSFSWWAQELNPNEDKIVLAPEYWFNQPAETVEELKVERGIKIPNVPVVETANENPFFSIIIPVYNTARTLRRTLASVLNQTFKNIEVILVDDGSTDNSNEILHSYADRDTRTRIFRHAENSSSRVARLTGTQQANGQYVLFLDSDDWLELDACERLHEQLEKKPVDALEFEYIREPSGEKTSFVKDFGNRLDALLNKSYPVTLWNKAYRRDMLQEAFSSFEPFYTTFAEDAFLSVVIAFFANEYDYIDACLHHYSITTGISTQNEYSPEKIKKIVRDCKSVEQNLRAFIKANAPEFEDSVSTFINDRVSFIHFLASQTLSPATMLKSFLEIDGAFGTTFFDDYVLEQDEALRKYNLLKNLPFFKKCTFATRYVLKKILKKLKIIKEE